MSDTLYSTSVTCQSFLTLLQKEKKKECRFFRVKNFDTNTDGITELSIFSSSGHPIQNQRVRFSWIYTWLLYIASVLRVLTRTRSSILNVLKGVIGPQQASIMMTMESRAGKRRERSIPYFPSHRPLRKALTHLPS